MPYTFGVLASLGLVWFFLRTLTVYWRHFRMGSGGGPGMFLLYVGLPAILLLAAAIWIVALVLANRRGWTPGQTSRRAVASLSLVLFGLFMFEFVRTGAQRGPESGGSVAAFLAQLF